MQPQCDQAGTGAAPGIVAWLLQELRFAPEPITRDVLAAALREHAAGSFGVRWSPSTASRRLREAINQAIREGWPIVSVDGAFQLAQTTTQRHAAAERLRKMAAEIMTRADNLEFAKGRGEQVEMFGRAV